MATPRKRVPWSHGDRLLMIVLALVVAGGGLGAWSHTQDRTPDVTVPMPTMPSPNAFDFYVRAGGAITGGAIISPSTPHQPLVPSAAQAAVVRQNAGPNGAIGLLHQGFHYPFHGPPVRSFSTNVFPPYQKIRGLARLLALQARVDAAQGDWAGAMTADLDCLRMGEDLSQGSGLIGRLVGDACENIGRQHAWQHVDHLNAAQARAAAQRLEAIRARHVPFADTMQEEKWMEQAGLLETMRQPGWPGGVVAAQANSNSDTPSFGETLSNWKDSAAIRATGKRVIFSNFTRYLDQRIASARQPYAAHPPEPTPASDPVSQMLFSSSTEYDTTEKGFRTNEAKADTENALLLTMLALRAYKLDHGTYPATLSALAPACLKAVPDDPFALSGPLRYKRTRGGYLLYSVGPDGKDDGGKPIFDAAKPAPTPPSTSDQRYYVMPDSQGDVVAGVNIY